MKDMIYLNRKYWAKHKKNAAALLFSCSLFCAVICCILLIIRQGFIRNLHKIYDNDGYYSFLTLKEHQDIIDILSNEDTVTGEIGVIGEMGVGSYRYTYGVLDDPHELMHIPFEAGRLPENEGEITITRGVLKDIGFFGSVGDKITLDKGTFTLVGIIKGEWNDEDFGIRYPVKQQYELAHSGDIYNDNPTVPQHWMPVIFVGGDHTGEIDYTWVMLDKINGETIPSDEYDFESFEVQFLGAWSNNDVYDYLDKVYYSLSRKEYHPVPLLNPQ